MGVLLHPARPSSTRALVASPARGDSHVTIGGTRVLPAGARARGRWSRRRAPPTCSRRSPARPGPRPGPERPGRRRAERALAHRSGSSGAVASSAVRPSSRAPNPCGRDGPATRHLLSRPRSAQLGQELAGQPRRLGLAGREVGLPRPPSTRPQDQRDADREPGHEGRQEPPDAGGHAVRVLGRPVVGVLGGRRGRRLGRRAGRRRLRRGLRGGLRGRLRGLRGVGRFRLRLRLCRGVGPGRQPRRAREARRPARQLAGCPRGIHGRPVLAAVGARRRGAGWRRASPRPLGFDASSSSPSHRPGCTPVLGTVVTRKR